MAYNILIADDHSIVRSGIKAILKSGFAVNRIDEATNEKEITEQVKSHHYDLAILDINIPDGDFSSLMSWLKVVAPQTHVLIFTMHAEDTYGRRALQLGANGYLHKTATQDEIHLAIHKVLNGQLYLSKNLLKIISASGTEDQTGNPFHKLSSRELEIALLINKGFSLPQICTTLNIQYSTANTYKRRIFEKLNIPNAVSLAHLMQTFKIES